MMCMKVVVENEKIKFIIECVVKLKLIVECKFSLEKKKFCFHSVIRFNLHLSDTIIEKCVAAVLI